MSDLNGFFNFPADSRRTFNVDDKVEYDNFDWVSTGVISAASPENDEYYVKWDDGFKDDLFVTYNSWELYAEGEERL